jgi:flagellum-specific ATP synthase
MSFQPSNINLNKYLDTVKDTVTIKHNGKVTQIIGLVIESMGPVSSIGEICHIHLTEKGQKTGEVLSAEVVGFKSNKVLLMPLGELRGISPGCEVVSTNQTAAVQVGETLLGRVIDGTSKPLDDKGPVNCKEEYPLYGLPIDHMKRSRIAAPLSTGIKAIDGINTCGKGQRLGIFSGSGVGKSVMMGMIARNTSADVNVIALIGERGRELREFIERDLQEEGLKKSVVVAVTSEASPLLKVRGALAATAISEYFRDQGKDVLLLMDSITRFAMALREIGLAIGEPPTTKGYTPSVFAALPKLVERAGCSQKGSITGLYTVLIEADDINDPISDAVRSVLDGHLFLSRKLASQGIYPAVDVLNSTSRVMMDIVSNEHMEKTRRLKRLLASYQEAEDLINIGAYVKGSNKYIDESISYHDAIREFLTQGIYDKEDFLTTENKLAALFSEKASEPEEKTNK